MYVKLLHVLEDIKLDSLSIWKTSKQFYLPSDWQLTHLYDFDMYVGDREGPPPPPKEKVSVVCIQGTK